MLEHLLILWLISSSALGASIQEPKAAASKRELDDARHASSSGSYGLGVAETLGSGAFSPLGIPGSLGNVYARDDYIPSLYYESPAYYAGGLGDYRAQSYLNYGGPFLGGYSRLGARLPAPLYGFGAGYPYYPGGGLLPRPLAAADAFYGRLSGYYD